MDSWRMSVLEEQKKKELEKMLNEREQLKLKQFQLIDDIIRFTNGARSFPVIISKLRVKSIFFLEPASQRKSQR